MLAAGFLPSALALLLGLHGVVARIGEVAVLTESTFDPYVRDNRKVLVNFFDKESRNEATLSAALRTARSYGCSARFAMVDADAQPKLAEKFVPNGGFPQLLWFQNGEATQYHRTLREASQIVDFAVAVDREPISEVKSESDASARYNRMILVRTTKGSALHKVAEIVASKHMDTVAFALLSGWQGAESLTMLDTDKASGAVTRKDWPGELTVDAIDRWVRQLITRSEHIPEFDDGAAKLVVGLNFEERVLNQPDKDVFLMVFAPWCGFSKRAMPEWESFARNVSHVEHLSVLKMDGSVNDSPFPEIISWKSFPTLFFVKAGSKQPVIVKGERTVAAYVDFARKHGSRDFALLESASFGDADL